MYRFLFTIAIALVPAISTAGLFGPSNYDECVLENMKGVSSDTAAKLVANSCRAKFEKKEPAKPKGPCKIYWDGFKFLPGAKPNDSYTTYSMDNDGVPMLEMTVPKKLIERLKFETEMSPSTGNFGKFFRDNYPQISAVCGFK